MLSNTCSPCRVLKPPWASVSKAVGRLVALALLAFFVSKVIIAVDKLQHEKIAISTSTHFEHSRLMPSISVCFRNKKEHYQYNGTEVELGLNITKCVNVKRLARFYFLNVLLFIFLFIRYEVLNEFKHDHVPVGKKG